MIIENTDALVITDVHQDLNYARQAIERESGNFEYLVFNGDWFDTYCPYEMPSVKETCDFINSLLGEYGEKLVMNYGNHDLPYYYLHYLADSKMGLPFRYACSGVTMKKAEAVKEHLSIEAVERTRFCVSIDGILVSHAGVLPELISPRGENPLLNFITSVNTVDIRSDTDNSIFNVGSARGGMDRYPGLLWCDWDVEFRDELGCPQIVGHTYNGKPMEPKGESYNIDSGQKSYALLRSGRINIKVL